MLPYSYIIDSLADIPLRMNEESKLMAAFQTPAFDVDTCAYKVSYQTHTQLPKHVSTC